jgi:hypothetical protein
MNKAQFLEMVDVQLERQAQKGKAMQHPHATWATIVMDYLGRAVRFVFNGETPSSLMLAKAVAVIITWAQSLEPEKDV